MPVKKTLAALKTLKKFAKRKKVEREQGRLIDRDVQTIMRRHALGYRGQSKAQNPGDQRVCIEAQIKNGHIPEGMTPDEAFRFVDPAAWRQDMEEGS
jgi:hypothetical protein